MVKNNESEKVSIEGFVVAMNDHEQTYDYPEEVKLTIRQEHQRDYLSAAKFINLSGADLCILEHEFGIFGGQNGVYILPLLHRLEIPLVVTLHTIIKNPSYDQKAVLVEICKMAKKLVVMSHKAIELLTTLYEVDKRKIVYIEHGVPDIQYNQQHSKKEFNLENKKVLLTFGFISRNKGIETVLKALPKVIEKYPEVLYIILGKNPFDNITPDDLDSKIREAIPFGKNTHTDKSNLPKEFYKDSTILVHKFQQKFNKEFKTFYTSPTKIDENWIKEK